jgi:hypothetical protein
MADLATKYAIPPEVMEFVADGFLEVLREDEAEKAIEFHIPSPRREDGAGRATSYSLTWTHPAVAGGAEPNFEVMSDCEDVGGEYIDLSTLDDLIAWLEHSRELVRRNSSGRRGLPTPEELSLVFTRILNEWLPPETIAEINHRNATPKYLGCCASHDFCDPNQAMIDAMESFNVHFYPAPAILALIDDAWALAKSRRFEVRSHEG